MTKKVYTTMGLEVAFNVPESVEEYNLNAKRANACLSDAIDNTVYRGSLAEFRYAFLHGVNTKEGLSITLADGSKPVIEGIDTLTGVARLTETKTLKAKNEDGSAKTSEVWAETEVEYFQRALAATKKTKDEFKALGQSVADLIAFDASEREKSATTGPKRIGKAFIDAATKKHAEGKLGEIADKLGKKLKRVVPVTIEDVAVAIKDFQEMQSAALLA